MHTSSKKLREFEELVRAQGCCVTGAGYGVQIHHVLGRKGRYNKQDIGGIYILPLHESVHVVTGTHPNAWHKNKNGFIHEFGHPRDLFEGVLTELIEDHDLYGDDEMLKFISAEQITAIMECPYV